MSKRPDETGVEDFIDQGSAPEAPRGTSPPPPPAPKHSREDVELAKHYGFSEAEIARMSPDQLVRDVARVQRAVEERTRTVMNGLRPQQQAPLNPPPPPEPSVWGDEEDEWEEEEGRTVKRKAKDEDFHPALARVIKRQAKELAELKKQFGVVNEEVQTRSRTEMAEAIDGGFEDLGDEYAGIFGTGTYETLEAGSDEAERRQLVWQRVRDSLAGKPRPTAKRIRQLVAQEAKKLFGRVGGGQGRQQQQARHEEPYNGGYEGAEAPVRRTPSRERDPNTNLFLSDAEINRRAEENRIRKAYEEGGVEQPTRRGAPSPRQNRDAAIKGVDELRRNWEDDDRQDVDQGRNGTGFEV